jgi:hypothetical protein
MNPDNCQHLELKKLADTMFQTFPSFKAGARFYRCVKCKQLLKASAGPKPIQIKVENPEVRRLFEKLLYELDAASRSYTPSALR